ncbi:MAG: hypothetical protein WCP34_09335 [Pseudomonadota bacterium]
MKTILKCMAPKPDEVGLAVANNDSLDRNLTGVGSRVNFAVQVAY